MNEWARHNNVHTFTPTSYWFQIMMLIFLWLNAEGKYSFKCVIIYYNLRVQP